MTWNDRYVVWSHWSQGADISVDIIGSLVNMPSFVEMKSFLRLFTELWLRLTMYVLSFLFLMMTDSIAYYRHAPQFSRFDQPYGSQVPQ
jgi:hypothetical protein